MTEIDWNVAPSWIEAIGALISSVGLIITLALQRKTLIAQQTITRLEQQRFLNQHQPQLEITKILLKEEGRKTTLTFTILIKENRLQDLRISHNFPGSFEVTIPYFISDVILPTGYEFPFTIQFTLEPVFIEIIEYSGNSITFTYKDLFSNTYEQHIIYKGAKSVFLHPAARV